MRSYITQHVVELEVQSVLLSECEPDDGYTRFRQQLEDLEAEMGYVLDSATMAEIEGYVI